ncbi:MAG: CHAT domain-containing protein [Leptolyngbyaceae cyanobacterium T60_A2020_046]|nr:CHAT domain-containing protein [Leptolyngbyaceae cyanobacterium T60_A2020_046]
MTLMSRWAIVNGVCLSLNGLWWVPSATAQPIQAADDGTGTVINRQGNDTRITGGARSQDGANLFHSFTEFNVGRGQSATFLADPSVLNILGRVSGGNASVINGLLQVSGSGANLFLINPSGILFGPDAALNLEGGFAAIAADGVTFGSGTFGTLGTPDYSALVGNPTGFVFSGATPGSVVNAGNLAVDPGQFLLLAGGQVINTGTLAAPGGDVVIAAVDGGNYVRISQDGLLLNLELEALPAGATEAQPFTPQSLPELLTGNAIAEATGVTVNPDGTVTLTGSELPIPTTAGTAIATGTLTTDSATGTGGSITVLGETIGLLAATLSASGSNGGGTIRVGGDVQGTGPLPTATTVYLDRDSTLRADSWVDGVGGNIIAWSEAATRIDGTLSARGGADGGDGGFIETSSRGFLNVIRAPDVGAAAGNGGLWLLDPNSIQLVDGLPDSNFTQAGNVFAPLDESATSIIDMDLLNAALDSGDVQVVTNPFDAVFTDGNIRVVDEFNFTSAEGNTLFLRAVGDIQIEKDLISGGVNFDFQADSDGNNNGQLISDGALDTGGNVTLRGSSATDHGVGIFGSIFAGGDVLIVGNSGQGAGVTISQSTLLGRNVTVRGTSQTGPGIEMFDGTSLSASRDVVLNGRSNSGIGVNLSNSSITAGEIAIAGRSGSNTGVLLGDLFDYSAFQGLTVVGRSGSGRAIESTEGLFTQGSDIALISAGGNIVVPWIDASGPSFSEDPPSEEPPFEGPFPPEGPPSSPIPGGAILISALQDFVRITEAGPSGFSLLTSGGSPITVIHGGNGQVPFVVGNASVNGTAADITSGNTGIQPNRSFFNSEIIGNIAILTASGADEPQIERPDRRIPNRNNNGGGGGVIDISTWYEVEQEFTSEYTTYFGRSEVPPPDYEFIRGTLERLSLELGVVPGVVYARFVTPEDLGRVPGITPGPDDVLELMLVTPAGNPMIFRTPGVTRAKILAVTQQLQRELTDRTRRRQTTYLELSQQLYGWLIAPMTDELEAQGIGHLSFVLPAGLRSLPLAVLHDGQQFVIERYTISLMPSLSLTDILTVKNLSTSPLLAMGASEFSDQPNLPAVPLELELILGDRDGESSLNKGFTPENLVRLRQAGGYALLHLATHGEFRSGGPSNSYIQFWDQRITLSEVRRLQLDTPPLELLVMSACRTALGDTSAELGFAGLAVQTGGRSALATLWQVSDLETAGLMAEFYTQLGTTAYKAKALQQAQLAMLRGEVTIQNGQIIWTGGQQSLVSGLRQSAVDDTTHPYYWASFTLVGSPW